MKPAGGGDDVAGVIMRPPLLFALFLGVSGLFQWLMAEGGIGSWPVPVPVRIAGGVMICLGLAAVIASARRFSAAGTNLPTWQPTTALVTGGLYSRSRNPVYIGLILIYCGIAQALGWWLAIVVLPILGGVLHFGIVLREEAYLERKFGEAYRRYKASVRRYL